MMKFKFFTTFLFLLLLLFAIPSKVFAAPTLYFDPANTQRQKDSNFEVKIQINTDGADTFGTDAIINYSKTDLRLDSVTNGGFFTDFASAETSTGAELHGYLSSLFDTKNGSGTFAYLKFTALNNNGTTSVTFTCTTTNEDTQILDKDGENILTCGSINQSNITLTKNPDNDPPNSCGGTCGSDANCGSNLICNKDVGFCRNPDCPTDSTCGCTAPTTTPTQSTPKPVVSPTPQVVVLTPFSTPNPEPETENQNIPVDATPAPATETNSQINVISLVLASIGLLLILGVVLATVSRLRNKSRLKQITSISENVKPPLPETKKEAENESKS